jgi:putative ABC transport system ATP-binding protein
VNGEALLRLERACRRYDDGPQQVTALAPTTLEIAEGCLAVVMGPSGSGKSTMLALLGGLDQPTEGRVLVAGRDVSTMSPAEHAELRRRVVGYVFQDLNLLAGLTTLENVTLPLELDGIPFRRAAAPARAVLAEVGLADKTGRFPSELSGGEQQRVAVARAMVGGRRLLLADEPTGSLDTATGRVIDGLLRGFCDAGGSCVMVTHDQRHAEMADLVIELADGVVTTAEHRTGRAGRAVAP